MSESSNTSIEVSKKRKRIRKYFGFDTFGDPGCPVTLNGPFRENIRFFLQESAEIEDYKMDGMPVWSTFLVHENRGFVVPLYTIEENVKSSLNPFCDHCRCVGWGHHFVSRRKYHLIIPVDEDWNKPLSEDALDLQTHLLHGLVHSNGYGHLICINGIEGGSKQLCGRELMDLWDRICTNLHTREITVEDVSKKHEMDLRLLHGIAYGHPWFGRWGYRFSRGSFGVTGHQYERAIETLRSLQLDKVIEDFSFTKIYTEVKDIIGCYRDMSETHLMTVQDLLKFMLALKSRPQMKINSIALATTPCFSSRYSERQAFPSKEKNTKCRKFSSLVAKCDSRWPAKRLEFTAEVIVDALKEKKAGCKFSSGVMSRQEVRDAARLKVGDTGLIDYVLKSMNNVTMGDYIIRRSVNRFTRRLEYTIQEVKKGAQDHIETAPETVEVSRLEPGNNVYGDVFYMYSRVILSYPESDTIKYAVGTILDGKCFVKEWPFRDEPDDLLRFICRLLPSLRDMETELTRGVPTGEYITVPLHSTIGDLKSVIQSSMRDTYCIMEHLVVTEIEGMEELEDNEVLFSIVESGIELAVRGVGLDLVTDLRYEGGPDNWTVRCQCGAEDDDGERMVSCDICEIWKHTRCCGIDDSEAVPQMFVCATCRTSPSPPRMDSFIDLESYGDSMLSFLPLLPDIDVGLLY